MCFHTGSSLVIIATHSDFLLAVSLIESPLSFRMHPKYLTEFWWGTLVPSVKLFFPWLFIVSASYFANSTSSDSVLGGLWLIHLLLIEIVLYCKNL